MKYKRFCSLFWVITLGYKYDAEESIFIYLKLLPCVEEVENNYTYMQIAILYFHKMI